MNIIPRAGQILGLKASDQFVVEKVTNDTMMMRCLKSNLQASIDHKLTKLKFILLGHNFEHVGEVWRLHNHKKAAGTYKLQSHRTISDVQHIHFSSIDKNSKTACLDYYYDGSGIIYDWELITPVSQQTISGVEHIHLSSSPTPTCKHEKVFYDDGMTKSGYICKHCGLDWQELSEKEVF